MTKLCDIDQTATEKLPPKFFEKSGVGIHYVDAMIKPMKTKLEDGTRVACRRKGLKLTLRVGKREGDGLLRRLQNGPDPKNMFSAALQEAATNAGITLKLTDTEMFIDNYADPEGAA